MEQNDLEKKRLTYLAIDFVRNINIIRDIKKLIVLENIILISKMY